MEGITKAPYRRLHQKYFGGAEKYYTPFISPTAESFPTPRELNEIMPERNKGVPLVVQLLTNSAESFISAARVLKSMGYDEVNFNLGCPSNTVVAKRKGSGLLAYPELLDCILSDIFYALDMKISVKTRLGISSPGEFSKILEVYNKYPICELIIHPRVQKDFYRLPARPEALCGLKDNIKPPFCYNGDVFFRSELEKISALFPSLNAVMLGRGLIRNPALIGLMHGEKQPEKSVFRAFHDELLDTYHGELFSEHALLCHMKELWSYMHDLFEQSEKPLKAIRKAARLHEYRDAVSAMFALPMKSE